MGTDIHMLVEEHVGDLWVPLAVPEDWPQPSWWEPSYGRDWYADRNYDLFAILADVRNGRGFAGIETGSGWRPISVPRGLPADVHRETRDGDLGDHSLTWLHLSEILDYPWDVEATVKRGVIDIREWRRMQATGERRPKSYAGDVWGNKVEILQFTDERLKDPALDHPNLHIEYRWPLKASEACAGFYKLLPRFEKLGDVRLVFGFDS